MRWLLCLLLICGSVMGQEITITPPPGPINVGAYGIISVDGLDNDLLPKASVVLETDKRNEVTGLIDRVQVTDAFLVPAKPWGGQPIILFSIPRPGTYYLTITVNKWKSHLLDSLKLTKNAISGEMVTDLENVVNRIDEAYPLWQSNPCVLEVTGNVPPPPPPPPPQPTVGKKNILILYETGSTSVALGALMVRLRDDSTVKSYLTSKGHQLMILDKDTKDENNQPSPLVKKQLDQVKQRFPDKASLDPLIIISNAADGSVVFADELLVTGDPNRPTVADIQSSVTKFLDSVKAAGG